MGNRIFNVRTLRSAAAAGFILAAGSALAEGYLAKVGPPPLRFQSPHPNRTFLPLFMANQTVSGPAKPSPDPSSNANVSPEESPANSSVPAPAANSGSTTPEAAQPTPGIPQPVISATEPAPANDLLVITPQMLVDYFKPMRGTNGAGATVVAPVTFTPPVPVTPPSSKATYKTQ